MVASPLQVRPQVDPFEKVALLWVQGALRQLKRVLVAHLEKPLEPRAAVLGAAAVVPVRKEDDLEERKTWLEKEEIFPRKKHSPGPIA